MNYAIIKHDGKRVGFAETEPQGTGALAWLHRNCPAYSASHAVDHERYSTEEVDEIDCHDVADFIEDICARIGVTMETKFVPFSQSRNAGEWKSLNWKCVFSKNGRVFLETDYSQGTGSCPADKWKPSWKELPRQIERVKNSMIAHEIETGRVAKIGQYSSIYSGGPIPGPRLGDVMHSLVRDSDILESSGFAEWATDFGYDSDSIKAKAIFDLCLEHALKLKANIGGHALEELRLVAQFN